MQHFENPEQIPALQYPSAYGSVPPAFARGTLVERPDGRSWFLSGTASINARSFVRTQLGSYFIRVLRVF